MSWQRICDEIEAQPRLTSDEERALREAHLDGDERAKPKALACTARYALGIARALARESGRWEPGDLLGEAVQAMSAAWGRWDGQGSFAAYVQPRIRGSMKDFLRRKADVMRGHMEHGRVLSLDAPEGDDGRTMLDGQEAPEIEERDGILLTKRERQVLAATVLRSPMPGTIEDAAAELKLSAATVSKILRRALQHSPATC